MAVPYVKQTWIDGSGGGTPTSAARLGVMEQGIYDAHRMPTARVYNSTSQTITSGARTTVALNSERWDTDTCHDNVTNNSRLTAKTAGVYAIIALSEWDADASGIRGLELWVNNATVVGADYRPAQASNSIVQSAPAQWLFAVNDYVEMKVIQDSGANRTLGTGVLTLSELMWTRVST